MRTEDKQLEGPDLEREQRVEATHQRQPEHVEELPMIAGNEVRDLALDHRAHLLDALQLILAGEELNISRLYLPQRETLALEALRTAVHGSDSVGEFVFAEDRRSLLEQALAVLQQNLTYGEPAQLAALQSKFGELTGQLAELREELGQLEDAQEERDEFHNAARQQLGANPGANPGAGDSTGDQADNEEPAAAETAALPEAASLTDFIASALVAMAEVSQRETATLAGEERDLPKPASSLTGPDRVEPEPTGSSLREPAAASPATRARDAEPPASAPREPAAEPPAVAAAVAPRTPARDRESPAPKKPAKPRGKRG